MNRTLANLRQSFVQAFKYFGELNKFMNGNFQKHFENGRVGYNLPGKLFGIAILGLIICREWFIFYYVLFDQFQFCRLLS